MYVCVEVLSKQSTVKLCQGANHCHVTRTQTC